jgi:hypothetical protein
LESLANTIPCSVFCLGIILKTPTLVTHYNSVKQGTIINHKLNKPLTSLQSDSFLLVGQTVWNKPSTDLPFSKIFY